MALQETEIMKRSVGMIGMIALIILAASAFAPAASQAADRSTTQTRGVYWFDPHYVGDDITDTYIYDDALLTGDSRPYDPQRATMTYELAVASISSERTGDYALKSQNLRAYLEDNGFVDFDTNEDYRTKMRPDTMGAACAHKKITDNGKEYTLLAIVPRSAGYEAEWNGNFTLGESGDHKNYSQSADKVLAFAKQYIQQYGISGDIKVWLAGYSRGAGVTNLAAKKIIDDTDGALGTGVTLAMNDFYCYAYGTPRAADASQDPHDPKYDYIHNMLEPYDIIASLPPTELGFDRYGPCFEYQTGAYGSEKYERMMGFFRETNPMLYRDYYLEGGNPFEFQPMKIDENALIKEGKFSFVPDDDSYLPDTQAEFFELFANSVAAAAGSREGYHLNYDDSLAHFGSYVMTHLGQMGDLFGVISQSRYSVPMAVSMYVAFSTERSGDIVIDEELCNGLAGALSELKEQIARLKEYGVDTTEIEAECAALEEALKPGMQIKDLADVAWNMSANLYARVMREAMEAAGADPGLIDQMTSEKESKAMCRMLAYVLLYDKTQTEEVSFDYANQQFCHLATVLSNGGRYMMGHTNEFILSWLREEDPSYDGIAKENAAQKAGYRRVFIDQPAGTDVTAVIKDGSGNPIARIQNGSLISSTDPWVAVTSCDTGNWLRLPVDDTYTVDLSVSRDAALSLRVAEYSVDEGKEVRNVTGDKRYKWQDLSINTKEKVTLHVSEVKASKGQYELASGAYYYITKGSPVLVAKGIARGKKAVKISWNGVPGADRYVVYMSKCNNETKKVAMKKVKTISAKKTSWKKSGLKKDSIYKFRVVAQQKRGSNYVTLATSRNGHFATGNVRGSFTNPKALKLRKTSLSMKTGKTAYIKGTIRKAKAGKKLISHEKRLRFISEDPAVAAVSAGGKVTAAGMGSCRIYVQAVNGMWKTVKVTVR